MLFKKALNKWFPKWRNLNYKLEKEKKRKEEKRREKKEEKRKEKISFR